jgi:hypothetical protein
MYKFPAKNGASAGYLHKANKDNKEEGLPNNDE